jgi:hypothetical protein
LKFWADGTQFYNTPVRADQTRQHAEECVTANLSDIHGLDEGENRQLCLGVFCSGFAWDLNFLLEHFYGVRTTCVVHGHKIENGEPERFVDAFVDAPAPTSAKGRNYCTGVGMRYLKVKPDIHLQMDFVFPFMRARWDFCMHPKYFLVFYPDRVRVAVSSANLTQSDYNAWGNVVWVQDFPRFTEGTASARETSNLFNHPFCRTLTWFTARLIGGTWSLQFWLARLQEYNFEHAKADLVASVPEFLQPLQQVLSSTPAPLRAKDLRQSQGQSLSQDDGEGPFLESDAEMLVAPMLSKLPVLTTRPPRGTTPPQQFGLPPQVLSASCLGILQVPFAKACKNFDFSRLCGTDPVELVGPRDSKYDTNVEGRLEYRPRGKKTDARLWQVWMGHDGKCSEHGRTCCTLCCWVVGELASWKTRALDEMVWVNEMMSRKMQMDAPYRMSEMSGADGGSNANTAAAAGKVPPPPPPLSRTLSLH